MSDLIDRQSVIDLLKQMRKDGDMVPWEGKNVFARIRMLPALQLEECTEKRMETHACDLISRWAALDAVEKNACNTQRIMDAVNNLPPAQPEPQEGHWIKHESPDGGEQYECSECGVLWQFTDGTPEDNEAYFCPKCGTKMKGEPNARTD